MDKLVIKRIIILLLLVIITFVLSKFKIIDYGIIKDYANSNINIRKYSEIYHNYYNKSSIVSASSNIDVKDVIYYENHIDVYPLNNKVVFPYSGLITSIKDNNIKISASNDEDYIIYNINKVKTNVYKYEESNIVLAYCDDYFSIKGSNLESLRYIISYEEI